MTPARRRARGRGLAAGVLVALGLAGLPAVAGPAAAPALLDFSDDERRRIAAHGPWPPPKPPRDPGNAVSGRPAAVRLGQALFHDPRLSPDGRFACASCHQPLQGLADGLPRAAGRDLGDRHTPTLWNTGYQRWWGWDGAADSLWHQARRALGNPREMAATPAQLAGLVQQDAAYRRAWRRVFGTAPVAGRDDERTAVQAAKALGAYTATFVSPRSAFDDFRDALLRGDRVRAAQYPLAAQRGLRLFVGRASCNVCHAGPLFSNGEFGDIGRPFFVRPGVVDPGRHGGIVALRASRHSLLGPHADRPGADATKTAHVELQHRNFGEFKVPSLRALASTAPYMHDGGLATLLEVVRHYNRIDLERLHADGERILRPLGLDEGEEADLVAFLRSLSDPAPRR